MTTYQGLAVVTQTIYHLLATAVRAAVPGAHVSMVRPEEQPAGARGEPRANLYLVQVLEEPTLRTSDLPLRNVGGQLLATPRVARNLRYLISFFGPSPQAQLMLGATDVALHERAVLTPELILEAVADHPVLQTSGLDAQAPPVRIVPVDVPLEELSRFWSGIFQAPYTLSTFYEASTVILESSLPTTVELPVRELRARPTVAPPPRLDPLPTTTFARGLTVPVTGSGLTPAHLVNVGGTWAPLTADAAGRLAFALPRGVTAGTHQVALGARPPGSAKGTPALIAGAASQPLTIRPAVKAVRHQARDGTVTVELEPAPRADQAIVLGLVASDGESLRVPAPSGVSGARATFPIGDLPAATYLATVEVDGAAADLGVVDGRYATPEVEIT